jgi:hypothetical protein
MNCSCDEIVFHHRRKQFVLACVWMLCALLLFAEKSFGQNAVNGDSVASCWNINIDSCNYPSYLSSFIDNVEPPILSDVQTVRAYIRDQRFQDLRKHYSDVCSIDFIYLKALQATHHDMARALFVSFLAVLEHRIIQIKMPFRLTIPVLLTMETDIAFNARLRHLPNNIYSDSPRGIARDRDKLQHFFGSAYLSFVLENPEAVHTIGDILEWAEPGMVVGGENDPRDKRANLQGEQFGRDLLIVNTLLPSDYLTLPYKDRK